MVTINEEHLKLLKPSSRMDSSKFVFESSGRIIYDPIRKGLKTKDKWWVIIQTDPDIVKYYRYYLKNVYHMHHVVDPAWGSHISILRGEKPRDDKMQLWNKLHAGKKINFVYTHEVYGNDEYWWLNVYAPELFEIRQEFNLPINFGFHLTVGKNKYKDL